MSRFYGNIVSVVPSFLFVLIFDIILLYMLIVYVGKQLGPFRGQALSDLCVLAASIFGLSSEIRKARKLLHRFNSNFYNVGIQTTMGDFMLLGSSFFFA